MNLKDQSKNNWNITKNTHNKQIYAQSPSFALDSNAFTVDFQLVNIC